MTQVEQLAAFAVQTRYEDLSEEARHQLEEAQKAFRSQAGANVEGAHLRWADATMLLGNFKEAEEIFAGVAALVPHSEVPLICLGNLAFSQGRYERALQSAPLWTNGQQTRNRGSNMSRRPARCRG